MINSLVPNKIPLFEKYSKYRKIQYIWNRPTTCSAENRLRFDLIKMVKKDHFLFVDTLNRRRDLIEYIIQGFNTRDKLEERMSLTSSAIYKKTAQLEEMGLIERTTGVYKPTIFCLLSLQRYYELSEIYEHQHFLTQSIPAEIDTKIFCGSDIIAAEKYAPDKPINELERLTSSADQILGATSVTSEKMVKMSRNQIQDGIEIKLVLERELVTHLNEVHSSLVTSARTADHVTIWATDYLPVGLVLSVNENKKVAGISIEGDSGKQGLILNDSKEAVESVEELYDHYTTTADLLF